MPRTPPDPLRARMFELLEQLNDRFAQLRDYGAVPGNAWLAKAELDAINQLASELDALLEEIKQSDTENGY